MKFIGMFLQEHLRFLLTPQIPDSWEDDMIALEKAEEAKDKVAGGKRGKRVRKATPSTGKSGGKQKASQREGGAALEEEEGDDNVERENEDEAEKVDGWVLRNTELTSPLPVEDNDDDLDYTP